MKFLFVHGWRGFSLAEWYLREACASDCRVSVAFESIDVAGNGVPIDDTLARVVASWQPDVVGFSCHFWSISAFVEAATWVKRLHPRARTVLGGPQTSSEEAAEALLTRYEDVDFVIRGEGEQALCRLLESLAAEKPVVTVPGLSFRGQDAVLHNPAAQVSGWNRGAIFEPGNRRLCQQLEQSHEASYETARGCRARCLYCVYQTERVAALDDDLVEAELSLLLKLRIRHLRICDAHFGGTAVRAKRFLRHLGRENRGTSVKIYPDLLHVDSEYIDLAQKAGVELTSIGIQTTNPTSLKVIRRPPMHRRSEAIRLVLEAFPDTPADLIFGLPGDTMAGFEQSLRDVLDLGFSEFRVFPLTVFPGTQLASGVAGFFEGGPVSASAKGQIHFSPEFPPESQELAANLIAAAEIAAPLVRARRLIGRLGRGSALLSLADCVPTGHLRRLRSAMTALSPAPALEQLGEISAQVEALHPGGPALQDAVALDLAEHVRRRCQTNGRRDFLWTENGRIRWIDRVHFHLHDGRVACWNVANAKVEIYAGAVRPAPTDPERTLTVTPQHEAATLAGRPAA